MSGAWTQVLGFAGLLAAAYWVAVFPHDDDGVDVPLRRLVERECWMRRFDPGLAVAS